MGEIRNFRDLDAWRLGMEAIKLTYRLTSTFPPDERFGLVSQMRRSAVSIPSNVAEGQAVQAPRWSLRHIVTAIGSSAEFETQLEAAIMLRFLEASHAGPLFELLARLRQVLYGLRRERLRRLAARGAVVGLCIVTALACVWM